MTRQAKTSAPDLAARLGRFHPKVIDLSLGRIERLLAALGHPEKKLPPVIHVAGTNGKGSVVAYLKSILEAAGKTVHAYTSPHLMRFNERIVVAGREITDQHLLDLIEESEAANGDGPITFFEITTAVALLAFTRTPADYVLLETGLGGRLDATNVVKQPTATVLTPISQDHAGFLGEDIAGIAREKAGILKPGVPCISTAQPEPAQVMIEARAQEVGASILLEGRDWVVRDASYRMPFYIGKPYGFIFQDWAKPMGFPAPALAGPHQLQNAGAAIATLRVIGEKAVDEAIIARGLEGVRWPARLQRLDEAQLPVVLPKGWQVWLDGGHNGDAARVLAQHAKAWNDKPLFMINGMMTTKSPAVFLTPFLGKVEKVHTVPVPGDSESHTAGELAAIAEELGLQAQPENDVWQAVRAITRTAERPGRILICGSLYLAGAVLADLKDRHEKSPAA